MNKIVSIKTTNAIFLAIVLVAGTITLFSPSFMKDVQAQQDYGGMDNNYENHYGKDNYKSKDSVLLKKLKCNNINVNLNGIEANIGGAVDSAAAASTQGSEQASASVAGNGERNNNWVKKFVDKDFGVICISNNNNNNILAGNDECPEAAEIKSCFEDFLLADFFELLVDTLESPGGLTVEIAGEEVTLRSFADICFALEGITTYEELREAITDIIRGLPGGAFPFDLALIDCIANALDIPIPPR